MHTLTQTYCIQIPANLISYKHTVHWNTLACVSRIFFLCYSPDQLIGHIVYVLCVCMGECVHPTVLFTVTDPNNRAWLNCAGADSAHWAGWYAAKLALPNRIWAIDRWRAGKRAFSLLALHNQRELTESWQLCSLWCSPRSCSCSTISSNEREEESRKIARVFGISHFSFSASVTLNHWSTWISSIFSIAVKECEQIYLTNSVLAELVSAGFLLKRENWLEI